MYRALKCLLLFGSLIHASVSSAAETYLIRPVYTTVQFKITKWMVLPEQGQFREFDGTMNYDPAHPDQSNITMTVQASSIDTKDPTRDGVLRSDDFFDVARFPVLTFKSTSVHSNGPNTLLVTGDFTVHGVTKRISFPVTVRGVHQLPKIGNLAGFETTFTINRRDYGVLGARWGAVPAALSDEVEIHLLIGAMEPAHR
ncbi:YceI family protein [Occallatibacter savannae]|uniref:YceI family protein n=1 Tax=Occallatibacter savannae TaxID=1002691 RepID=UPI000D68B307|nr:YceI family protein [Occallatibacter savannae]